jgi:predicted Zn-dependent protease
MEARWACAHLLVDQGRFDEGLEQAREACELDPLSPVVNAIYAGLLTAAGQSMAARKQLERALDLKPDFWIALQVRGGIALDDGDTAAAIADLDLAVERSGRASQILAAGPRSWTRREPGVAAGNPARAGSASRRRLCSRHQLRRRACGAG